MESVRAHNAGKLIIRHCCCFRWFLSESTSDCCCAAVQPPLMSFFMRFFVGLIYRIDLCVLSDLDFFVRFSNQKFDAVVVFLKMRNGCHPLKKCCNWCIEKKTKFWFRIPNFLMLKLIIIYNKIQLYKIIALRIFYERGSKSFNLKVFISKINRIKQIFIGFNENFWCW